MGKPMNQPGSATSSASDNVVREILAVYLESARRLWAPNPGAWVEQRPGVTAFVSGTPYANFNSVFVQSSDADPEIVDELITDVAATGLPHGLRTRPGLNSAVLELAKSRGFSVQDELPLMALERKRFTPVPDANLPVRILGAREERIHLQLVADGLGGPVGAIEAVMARRDEDEGGARSYLVEVQGELAATGSALPCDDHVGLIAIVTHPDHRRKGYAAALTSRMVADAFRDGARRVFLHASPMSFRMYESLGFEFLEHWSIWTRGSSSR
jgi:GNAT superfamily N-acetyltransferase